MELIVLIQLFVGNPPFFDISSTAMISKVCDGERPPRPGVAQSQIVVTDDMWALVEACWHHSSSRRPSMAGAFVTTKLLSSAKSETQLNRINSGASRRRTSGDRHSSQTGLPYSTSVPVNHERRYSEYLDAKPVGPSRTFAPSEIEDPPSPFSIGSAVLYPSDDEDPVSRSPSSRSKRSSFDGEDGLLPSKLLDPTQVPYVRYLLYVHRLTPSSSYP
jgi:hypothetical protein